MRFPVFHFCSTLGHPLAVKSRKGVKKTYQMLLCPLCHAQVFEEEEPTFALLRELEDRALKAWEAVGGNYAAFVGEMRG